MVFQKISKKHILKNHLSFIQWQFRNRVPIGQIYWPIGSQLDDEVVWILTFKLGSECVTIFVVTNVCYNKPVCNEDDSAGFKLVDAVLVLVGIDGYAMLGFG